MLPLPLRSKDTGPALDPEVLDFGCFFIDEESLLLPLLSECFLSLLLLLEESSSSVTGR